MRWLEKYSLSVLLAGLLLQVPASTSVSDVEASDPEGGLQKFRRDLKTTVYKVFDNLDLAFKRILDVPMFNTVHGKEFEDVARSLHDAPPEKRQVDPASGRPADPLDPPPPVRGEVCESNRSRRGSEGEDGPPSKKTDRRTRRVPARCKRTAEERDPEEDGGCPYVVSVHKRQDGSYVGTGVAVSPTVVATPWLALHDARGYPLTAADLYIVTRTAEGEAERELAVSHVVVDRLGSEEDVDRCKERVALLYTRGLDRIAGLDPTGADKAGNLLPKNCRVVGLREPEGRGLGKREEGPTRLQLRSSRLTLTHPAKCCAFIPAFNGTSQLCWLRRKSRCEDWMDGGDAALVCGGRLVGFAWPRSLEDARRGVTVFSRVAASAPLDSVEASLARHLTATAASAPTWAAGRLIASLALLALY